MNRTAVINVVGLTQSLIGDDTPRIRDYAEQGWQTSIKPAFPAVTCTAQSDYLTGVRPEKHGIVGNGWYDREYCEVNFWKQSDHLVTAPKIWEDLKRSDPAFTCAKLFWWYNMYSSADYSITPRPIYPADGRKVFDIYTSPLSLRPEIKRDLGEFPFQSFWGPGADIRSSEWIAESAKWIEENFQPTLSLIYLPHLDYNLQRFGPNSPEIKKDLDAIDELTGNLIDFFRRQSVQVVLLSEYGIMEVSQPIHLNRLFRERGWVVIKDELGLEQLDCGASKVFAVADHQIAHIYISDSSITNDIRNLLESTPGVENILFEDEKKANGINHRRSGDLIAVADEQSWFTYYYWLDDAVAPDYARCVDIHRKIGYDPAELFIDPTLKTAKLRVIKFLVKKKLGFRGLLDIIPLDAGLVKGSHGRMVDNSSDYPVCITPRDSRPCDCNEPVESTDLYQILRACVHKYDNVSTHSFIPG